MKTSCYVIGAAYSGTTLFNTVMDTQPGVRGIGEAVRHIHRGPNRQHPWCASCNGERDKCDRTPDIKGSNIHEAFFKQYPDTNVLIDISKSWDNCFQHQKTHHYIKIISMVKDPHAFAWSQYKHFIRTERKRDVQECFDAWLHHYRSAQMLYDRHCGFTLRNRQEDPYPLLNADDIMPITYTEFVTQTAATVERVCAFLGVPFDADAMSRWYEPSDTCCVGGNQAVYAQRNNPTFFTKAHNYLDGKYHGKHRQIFQDTTWLGDEQFMLDAADCYQNNKKALRPLTMTSGLGKLSECVKRLRTP